MSTDRELLLATIIAHPEDNLVRGVFADFIRERGEETWADFINLQLDLSTGKCLGDRLLCQEWEDKLCYCNSQFFDRCKTLFTELIGRQMVLDPFEGFWDSLFTTLPPVYGNVNVSEIRRRWDRGFVYRIDCTKTVWVKVGKEICATHPITEVRLTDADSLDTFRSSAWFVNYHNNVHPQSDLPEVIYRLLKPDEESKVFGRRGNITSYRSKRLATAALSKACLEYGRAENSPSV